MQNYVNQYPGCGVVLRFLLLRVEIPVQETHYHVGDEEAQHYKTTNVVTRQQEI